jgi:hypothetical protein
MDKRVKSHLFFLEGKTGCLDKDVITQILMEEQEPFSLV